MGEIKKSTCQPYAFDLMGLFYPELRFYSAKRSICIPKCQKSYFAFKINIPNSETDRAERVRNK